MAEPRPFRHTTRMRRALLALLLAAGAQGAELTVSDEKAELAARPSFYPGRWTLTPVLKGGVLALTESFPYPYPVLRRSPYGLLGLKAVYSGTVEAAAVVTAGLVDLRTRRLFDDPQGALGSPANAAHGRDLSQTTAAGSVYLDVGKTLEVGGWKGAVFAAVDALGFRPLGGGTYAGDALLEGNVGTAWAAGPLTLYADAAFEAARRKLYRNDADLEAVPSFRAGAEYGMPVGRGVVTAGLEAETRRADDSLRPSVRWEDEGMRALLAAELRRSKDPFFPDSQALAAGVSAAAAGDLRVGLTARWQRERYALAPGAENDVRVGADLTWTPRDKLVVQSAKTWAAKRSEEFSAARQAEVQAAAAARTGVREAIAAAPTLGGFYDAYKPKDSLGVLAAAAEFTKLFSDYNYNRNEGTVPNLDEVGELYARTRGSYLSGRQDPTLVCLGAAQFTAAAAEELARRAGVALEASGISVETSDAAGRQSGHAVAAIKTREYGIVFADWGRLTPTYTWDTKKALRLYQALSGEPALFHEVTDPGRDGRHVGYLFTEEGKLLVETLTFQGELDRSPAGTLLAEDPRGDLATVERYKGLLKKGSSALLRSR